MTSDGGLSSESVSNSPEKGMNSDKNDLVGMSHEGVSLSQYTINVSSTFVIKSLQYSVVC